MSCVVGLGYFTEVGGFGSRVYTNNELSAVLREDHPQTMKQAVYLIGDEGFRSTSRLVDAAKLSPATNGHANGSASSEVAKRQPASNIAFGFNESIFEWMASPSQAFRTERLGKSMQQLHSVVNLHVQDDYPWGEIPSPLVDIGGGIGTLEMSLLKFPKLEFILFDLPKTVETASKVNHISIRSADSVSDI